MAKSRWAELPLMVGDVLRCLAHQFGIVLKKPDSCIAVGAKQSSNPAGSVAVVNSKSALNTAYRFMAALVGANGAHTALFFKHCVILFWLNTKALLSAYVGQLAIQAIAVAFSVSHLSFASAVLAKPLQLINLSGCKVKLRYRLNGIASAAPLHTWLNSRATLRKLVMPMQVCKRLAFNPSTVFSIARRNFCWPPTTTLANTLWNNLVSHLIVLNHKKVGI